MTAIAPEDGILFPIIDLDRRIANAILKMSPPPKWPAVNAVGHLNGAWKLREIDPRMAALRAITAEEEAASALFQSLKRRRYEGAAKLKHDSHAHKHAVIPFLEAIAYVLGQYVMGEEQSQLYLDTDADPPRLLFRYLHRDPESKATFWAYPQPPLHGVATRLREGEVAQVEDFADGVNALLAKKGAKDMLEYARDRIQDRNRILYASDKGLYRVDFDPEKTFAFYRDHTFAILRIYFMIDPYPQKQLFVQQALTAFLHHIKAIPAK